MQGNVSTELMHTILALMTNQSPLRPVGRDRWAYRKSLAASRAAVKRAISETLLNGAKIDRYPTDVFSETFKSGKKTKSLASALGTVPGLELDHTFLVRIDGKVIGLITMPYNHRADFSKHGSNVRAIWSTHDELSWHFPGQTRLTIVFDKAAMEV